MKNKKETLKEIVRRVINENQSIQIVVCDENTLGYIDPTTPNKVNVLNSLISKGADTQPNKSYYKDKFTDIRPATSKDFNIFRVSETGYRNDQNYKYKR